MRRRRQKFQLPKGFVRNTLIGIAALVLLSVIFWLGTRFFTTSDYFTVEEIMIDPSLDFLESRALKRARGMNIFAVDTKGLQRQLQRKYPQITQLQIVRKFPDKIAVMAKQRTAIARIKTKKGHRMLDASGIVIGPLDRTAKDLTVILGVRSSKVTAPIGRRVRNKAALVAIQTINAFAKEKSLENYRLNKVNVRRLSQINLYLSDNFKVIIDQERIVYKMKLLGLVLGKPPVELEDVRYIDLRFREPILGKKMMIHK